MNLEDLRAAQIDERATDSLQPLPAAFYAQAGDYLAELRRRRDRLAAHADRPFESAEVRGLTDELETAEEVVEALYERRVGKVVKRASLAAAGVPTDDEGLTDEEQSLFTDLVARIEANRESVLDVLAARARAGGEEADGDATDDGDDAQDPATAGDASIPETAETSGARPVDDAAGTESAEALPDASSGPSGRPDSGEDATDTPSEESAAGSIPDGTDRVTVRITADVGEIYGVDDRVYTLGNEDVVTLPEANARPLLDRGAAQQLE